MNILSRPEIIALFKSNELKIETPDNNHLTAADLGYSKQNPFQQCSLDLRVGAIYIPESKDGDTESMSHPKTDQYVLGTGGTVLIKTKEKITLPRNVGAICFSPSSMALKGVMITNMGHVDPGYSGHLHFTAINMGKEPYGLKVNFDTVCTVLLFKLSQDVDAYGGEHIEHISINQNTVDVSGSVYYSLPKLSKDFLNVEKRAQDVAKKVLKDTKLTQMGVPLLVAAIMAAPSFFQTFFNRPWETEIQKASNKIEVLEKKIDYENRITLLERKLEQITAHKSSQKND